MKYFYLFILMTLLSCSTFDVAKVSKTLVNKVVETEKTEVSLKKTTDFKPVKKEQVVRKFTRVKNTKKVETFCNKTQKKFAHWGWGLSRCKSFQWNHVRDSFLGDPLMWVTFGKEKEVLSLPKEKRNVTMILCGVHGDEITPVKFCYDILHYLYQLQVNETQDKNFDDKLIVVAPIANPDSFFRKRPTRTNYRGVDINRNFPTRDWNGKALSLWKKRYRRDKRRYPGKKAMSEPETYFQVNLIKRYQPSRIISVHAPLTILDYDGPTLSTKALPDHNHGVVAMNAMYLLEQMSKKASGYRIKNYPFFPGSLGNYAGNERHIPTYTLELPSSDNRNHKKYWKMFKTSIDYALFFSGEESTVVKTNGDEGTLKSSN